MVLRGERKNEVRRKNKSVDLNLLTLELLYRGNCF